MMEGKEKNSLNRDIESVTENKKINIEAFSVYKKKKKIVSC